LEQLTMPKRSRSFAAPGSGAVRVVPTGLAAVPTVKPYA
jgi:hypothetical protein